MTIVPGTSTDRAAPAPACAGLSLNTFYDFRNYAKALEACAACPLQALCLQQELQLSITHQHGVRGGHTPNQRKQMIRGQRRALQESIEQTIATVVKLTPRVTTATLVTGVAA